MTTRQQPPEPSEPLATLYPLEPGDPVKVGDFWLDARLTQRWAGTAFTAHEDGGDTVMLLLLSEGAAQDYAARSRFSGEINAMHIDTVVARGGQDQNEGRMGVRFRDEADDPNLAHHTPPAPWVALAFSGTVGALDEANRVLHAVDLATTAPLGTPKGPDFSLHWTHRSGHGTTRLWPLPWPGRMDRASWITFLTSWLLMVLLAAVAVLLAILLFQNAPMVSPPPPVQPSSGQGGSGSQDSSQSPNASPSQSQSGSGPQQSESLTPTMQNSGEGSQGPNNPSPNEKLWLDKDG